MARRPRFPGGRVQDVRNGELPGCGGGARVPSAGGATARGRGKAGACEDGGRSSHGSLEGGTQDGGSSRGSAEGGSQEDPRSDHTSNHSGTTVFSSESGSGSRRAPHPEDRPGRARDGALLADELCASLQVIKFKYKKRDADKKQDAEHVGFSLADGASTLHISNVPTYFTQGSLLAMLEDLTPAMRGNFDFFHCPWRQEAARNAGYATINFTGPAHARTFQQAWSNKELCRSGTASDRPLRVTRASRQGLQANVEHCLQSAAGSSADARFRPLLRDGHGLLSALLAPAEDPSAVRSSRPRGPVGGRSVRR